MDIIGNDLSIFYQNRIVRLKWHKLRRRIFDAPFLRKNLIAGAKLGASLEIDLRQLACGNFVCLHYPLLENETTGIGLVKSAKSEDIIQLRMLETPNQAPLLLDQIVEILKSVSLHPKFLLQLDIKGSITEDGINLLAATISPIANHIVAGGKDWSSIVKLANIIPNIKFGYNLPDYFRGDQNAWDNFIEYNMNEASLAQTLYISWRLFTDSIADGINLVENLKAQNFIVDCWTIDPEYHSYKDLQIILDLGVDQVTTNRPRALCRMWEKHSKNY